MHQPLATLLFIPKWVQRRIESFDYKLEDVFDIQKMSSILSPDEMILYYGALDNYPLSMGYASPLLKGMHQPEPGCSSDMMQPMTWMFLKRFSVHDAIQRIADPEYRSRIADTLGAKKGKFTPDEIARGLAGDDADLSRMIFELNFISKDIAVITFIECCEGYEQRREDVRAMYYNICQTIHQYYGFRKVVSTQVFSELERLSRLS